MTTYSIRGQVIGATSRQPLSGIRVEAWDKDLLFDDHLGSALTDAAGEFTIEFDERFYKGLLDRRPDVYFKLFRGTALIKDTRWEVLWNLRAPTVRVVLLAEDVSASSRVAPLQVEGQVTTETGTAVPGTRVEVWDRGVTSEKLLAHGVTDSKGRYSLAYDPRELQGKAHADIQVRLFDPRQNGAEVARSPVSYDVAEPLRIDLRVQAASVVPATEYERLTDATQAVVGKESLVKLDAKAVEYVANRSGWDARLVAMAARSEQLSAATGVPADHHYALLRAGLSDDVQALYRLPEATIKQALELAVAGRVITAAHSIDATLEIYRRQSVSVLGAFKPEVAVSSLGAMLAISLDQAKSEQFLDAYRTTAGSPGALWPALREKGFDDATITRLQTDAKLGQLTLQNAPLVARLRERAKISAPEDLVQAGLYEASAWKDLIGADVAGGVSAEAYAAGLAAQVKLQYPTLVTAELLARGQLGAGTGQPALVRATATRAEASTGAGAAAFLKKGAAQYAIGVDPVKSWLGFAELDSATRADVQRVERLYQLSPSNESMIALDRQGLSSAYDIARQPVELFMAQHGDAFPSTEEAQLVYQKAQEIHATTLNVTTTYLAYRSAPNVYAISGAQQKPQSPSFARAVDAPGVPTLEELFQNMDYCACDECKSVLGPAAYFVELLQLIDQPAPTDGQNPQTVLFTRRPDLQHLLLSCENTNIALPYIDVVNEILEHYVVNGSLAAFAGHNLGEDSKSADLLADPEFVEEAAYDRTKAEVFPHPLPFDMPLAALRLLLQGFGCTLPDALRLFGTAAAARRETLELNASELRLLSDTTFRSLAEYFGEAPATTIDGLNAAIANGKVFCRRVEISYQDLVAMLGTAFVNPGAALVPLLEGLTVSLAQLQSWYAGTLNDAGLVALFPPGLDAAAYGGDILAWLLANRSAIMGMVLLTDVGTTPAECDFAAVELRFALPDATLNRLDELAYHKLHRFIRLWRKLGWTIELTDLAITTFLGVAPLALSLGTLDGVFSGLLARLANFVSLMRRKSISSKTAPDWLGLWDTTQTQAVRLSRLAHLLRVDVTSLEHLQELTGIDPLADDMQTDSPSLLRFLDALAALKASGLKVVDVDYLLRSLDLKGALTPAPASLLRDLKALRDGLTSVDATLDTPPGTVDLAYAAAKMALVYDATVVQRFIGLITDGTTYGAPFATSEELLPGPLVLAEPRLGFDPFEKRLTYPGVMSAGTQTALGAAADTLVLGDMTVIANAPDLLAYVAAFKVSVQALFAAGKADVDALGAEYPELKTAYDAVQAAAPEDRIATVVTEILPTLRQELKELSLRTTLSAGLKLDSALVGVLTEGSAVLHADGDLAHGVLADLVALETELVLDAAATYELWLDPPATDDYIVYVDAPAGTTVTLEIDGVLQLSAVLVGVSGELGTAAPVPLTAGALTRATLTLSALPGGATAALSWRTKGMAKAPVPRARLYLDAKVSAARASLLRLQKATLLLKALALTPAELRRLAAIDPDAQGLIGGLDTAGTVGAADLNAQWARLSWWLWFCQLKQQQPSDDAWVTLLAEPDRTTPDGRSMLAAAGGWSEADLTAVLSQLAQPIAGLTSLRLLRRAKEAADFVTGSGQPGADLLGWITDAPDAALITTIKDTLRAREDALSWRTTLQSVNDALRNLRRDALVSYLLHHAVPAPDIDTADKLYEYFLLDVAMDACMLTSRIRLALSTVQLFVMRCLMNLEAEVSASSIRADWWAWMKRYRVWEANRKIFLYPENWLEPELRDNKSSFFKELESDLLKADITDDLAEEAYLDYLKKLDDVARLEMVGSYLQEIPDDDDILHVFGRTIGSTRQYYYRRLEHGYWTPWEKISLHIESDNLFPVMWKGQLFLFWLSPLQKPKGGDSNETPQAMGGHSWAGSAYITVELNLAWGEYYGGKWTSPKSSEVRPPVILTNLTQFDPRQIVIAGRIEPAAADVSERLILTVLYLGGGFQDLTFTFTSKNSRPRTEQAVDSSIFSDVDVFNYSLFWSAAPTAQLASGALQEPGSAFHVEVEQPPGASTSSRDELILTKTSKLLPDFTIRPILHTVKNQWEAPFFYADEHSLFLVQPKERVWNEWHGYYYGDLTAVAAAVAVEVPPLYQRPVPVDPGDPVEMNTLSPVVNPLEAGLNPRYDQAISNNQVFEFGGASFDARGIAEVGAM